MHPVIPDFWDLSTNPIPSTILPELYNSIFSQGDNPGEKMAAL